MVRSKWSVFYVLLFSALACRAVSGPAPMQPPAEVRPAATMAPLPSVTSKPVEPLQAEASETPEMLPTVPAEATLELPDALPTDMSILPMGTPYLEDSYHGVPLMPGAQNPSEDNGTLTFTTQASVDETLKFYQDALKADGWQFLGGDVENPDSKVAIYTKGIKQRRLPSCPAQ